MAGWKPRSMGWCPLQMMMTLRALVGLCVCLATIAAHGQEASSARLAEWLKTPEGRSARAAVRHFPQAALSVPTYAGPDDQAFVRTMAKAAWRCLDDLRDAPSGLPLDRVDLWPRARLERRTSTNNTGLYLAAIVAAGELGFYEGYQGSPRRPEAGEAAGLAVPPSSGSAPIAAA